MHTSAASPPFGRSLTDALTAAGEPLLFGVRLWASVCLALYVAFWLELDNPFWAGTSAAIVCQPQLGASLRKGWFRMIGTVVGATMIVVLTAWFPQDRIAFLVLWRCGAGSAPSPPPCCATSRPTRRRSPATPRRSSPPTSSARPEARAQRSSCWRSGARARSASESCAPASSSPGPISAAPSGGWRRHSPIWRPRSRADLPACWRWRGRNCRTRKPSDASSSGASSRSTR